MSRPEKTLVVLLRFVSLFELMALPFVVIPTKWMVTIHRFLEMGEMSTEPVVVYLARSLSLFYAVHGGLTLYITFELRRYWGFLRFWGIVIVLIGFAMIWIDLDAGMPVWWTASEGPFAIAFGVAILWLRSMCAE